jgi:hypothetical protein
MGGVIGHPQQNSGWSMPIEGGHGHSDSPPNASGMVRPPPGSAVGVATKFNVSGFFSFFF